MVGTVEMEYSASLRSMSSPSCASENEFGTDLSASGATTLPFAKPIVLLDVDGVLNFFMGRSVWETSKMAWIRDRSRGIGVQWSPTVVDKLNDWFDSGLAEIRWLTSWDNRAQEKLAPELGLRHFELARNPAENIDKDVAADRTALAEPERPIVWIDDEVLNLSQLVKSDWISKDTTLLIHPVENEGLTPEHLEKIESFLVGARENRFPPNEWK